MFGFIPILPGRSGEGVLSGSFTSSGLKHHSVVAGTEQETHSTRTLPIIYNTILYLFIPPSGFLCSSNANGTVTTDYFVRGYCREERKH